MQSRFLSILLVLVQLAPLALEVQCNDNDIQARYGIIDTAALCYKRPFTAVEIGACNGDCSFYLATHYRTSVVVMIEGNEPSGIRWADQLLARCKQSHLLNIILLGDLACSANLMRLGECEHFDLVFSFWGIERAGVLWKECIDGLLTLGDHLIVEVPNNHHYAQNYLDSHGAQIIARLSESNLYYISCNKDTLKRKTWLRTLESTITIRSTFTEKNLLKKRLIMKIF